MLLSSPFLFFSNPLLTPSFKSCCVTVPYRGNVIFFRDLKVESSSFEPRATEIQFTIPIYRSLFLFPRDWVVSPDNDVGTLLTSVRKWIDVSSFLLRAPDAFTIQKLQ